MTEYIISEDSDSQHKSYGIAALNNKIQVKAIPAVFQSLDDARKIVKLLNTLEVEACHFEDIIEDYLTDFKI